MKRKFLLAHVNGRTARIVGFLLLLALPTSGVLASRGGLPEMPASHPITSTTGDSQIPNWSPPLDPEFSKWDNAPVTFDLANGAVEQGRFPDCKTCSPKKTDYLKPDPSPTPVWPASPTVKIIATWPSDETTECSGVLIDSAAALTAGHCIFTHTDALCNGESSCWVKELTTYLNYGTPDVQESSFTQLLTWTAWTENRDFRYDLAGVKLDQPLGSNVGWLGFGYNNDTENQFFPITTFEYMSYPYESGLHTWTGQFAVIEDHHFFTDNPSDYGQSGAAAHSNDYFHIVYSVLSHHQDFDGDIKTAHTRITPDKFFALRDWINGGIKAMNFIYYMPFFPE